MVLDLCKREGGKRNEDAKVESGGKKKYQHQAVGLVMFAENALEKFADAMSSFWFNWTMNFCFSV